MSTPAATDPAAVQALAELRGLKELVVAQHTALREQIQASHAETHRRIDDHGRRIERLENNERELAQKVARNSIVTSMVTSLLTSLGIKSLGH